MTEALDSSTSAEWQLDSYEGGDMVAVDTGRLSCNGQGSGVYAINGGESQLTTDSDFTRQAEHSETMPADIQAAGGIATDDDLYSPDGDQSWAIGTDDPPTEYMIDATISRQVNCSHITSALSTADLKYVDSHEAAGVPADRWRGEATVSALKEHSVGFATQDYSQLTDMGLGEAVLEVELWVDAEGLPVVYYQHLSPQQSGLQDRWFAITLTSWNEADKVESP
ncbi:hypothetical protein HNR23_000713 [Nocardiopsis mwathae]|uniref:Uncharacterized protein n=1 Tax=Nocardiopsis mwathae TaxID=1472723 RepID=A0A7W9YEF6_9ACTN|nr:hypothetical protein [Nocardiopsis mwathae]MBB6170653.1 hypothetical protein [Nocardiopsis mwathae]